jgi:hypothetical protein
LKIDRYVKVLSRRLDTFSSGGGDSDEDHDNYGLYKHDDDYYLGIGSEPPRFAYYRHVRIEQSNDEYRKRSFEAAYDGITQDELDFSLKRKLRMTPEQRYQREKEHWYWHESSWCIRGLAATGYDGYGCNNGKCIPECRYYSEYGRIEDEEVIEEHNKLVEYHRQKNAIVEPPSESELLRLAKIYRIT